MKVSSTDTSLDTRGPWIAQSRLESIGIKRPEWWTDRRMVYKDKWVLLQCIFGRRKWNFITHHCLSDFVIRWWWFFMTSPLQLINFSKFTSELLKWCHVLVWQLYIVEIDIGRLCILSLPLTPYDAHTIVINSFQYSHQNNSTYYSLSTFDHLHLHEDISVMACDGTGSILKCSEESKTARVADVWEK